MNFENCSDENKINFSTSIDGNCPRISRVENNMLPIQHSFSQKSGFTSVAIKCEEPEMNDSDTSNTKIDSKLQILNTHEQSGFVASVKADLFEIKSLVKQEFVSNQEIDPTGGAIKCEETEICGSDATFSFEEAKIINNTNEQPDFNTSNANMSVNCDPLATETYVKQENEVYVDASFSTFNDCNSDTDQNSEDDRSVSANGTKSELKVKNKTSFHCDVCNETFTRRTNLKNHILKHTGEKPYLCDICEKTFSRLSYLNDHKRIHTGEKPFQCDVCNKTFNRSCALSRHKNTHTGAKPYQCDVCNKYYTQCSTLKIHKRVHSGEKPHQCDVCNKSFSQSQQLRTHKRTHIGEKPFRYEICVSISKS